MLADMQAKSRHADTHTRTHAHARAQTGTNAQNRTYLVAVHARKQIRAHGHVGEGEVERDVFVRLLEAGVFVCAGLCVCGVGVRQQQW